MKLFPHQQEGAEWLAIRQRAILADAPGLGKTYTALAAAQLRGLVRILVLCPAVVRGHWRKVSEEFGGGDSFCVASYDEFIQGSYSPAEYDGLILDEAHHLRTMTAKRTQMILGKGGFARRIDTVWALTGTPVWKHPGNLWPLMVGMFSPVLQETGIVNYSAWLNRFCSWRWDTRYRRIVVYPTVKRVDELRALLQPIMLRRTVEDVQLALPRVYWQLLTVDDTEVEQTDDTIRSAVERYVHDAAQAADLAILNQHLHVLGRRKVVPVSAILTDMLENDSSVSVVVFARHLDVIDGLFDRLKGFGVSLVIGATAPRMRDLAIRQFQTGRNRVFLGQIQTAREGITLTRANRVVIVEPAYSFNENLQAGYRVVRLTQAASTCLIQLAVLANSPTDYAICTKNLKEAYIQARLYESAEYDSAYQDLRDSV